MPSDISIGRVSLPANLVIPLESTLLINLLSTLLSLVYALANDSSCESLVHHY